MVPTAIIVMWSVLNAALIAFLVCQVVELLLALRIALNRSHAPRAVFALLAQFLGLPALTLLAILALIELAISNVVAEHTNRSSTWPITSSGIGMGIFLLGVILSPRFREQISAEADYRLAACSSKGTRFINHRLRGE